MAHMEATDMGATWRRRALRRAVMVGLLSPGIIAAAVSFASAAEKLSCAPPQRTAQTSDTPPANKKLGVSVAYLKVPFYANFRTGLEDGAKQFGFTYDLVDGNGGDVATELAIFRTSSPGRRT